MREIEFRGKSIKTGEWVYGSLTLKTNSPRIAFYNKVGYWIEVEVVPESIGQYTGLNDKNDKKIFEGDVLLAEYGAHNEMLSYFVVQMISADGCWGAIIYYDYPVENNCFYWKCVSEFNDREIIGNVCEHKHLIESE